MWRMYIYTTCICNVLVNDIAGPFPYIQVEILRRFIEYQKGLKVECISFWFLFLVFILTLEMNTVVVIFIGCWDLYEIQTFSCKIFLYNCIVSKVSGIIACK